MWSAFDIMKNDNDFKAILASTGLTKQKVAQIAGVVPSTVSRWVSGEVCAPPLVLEKLRKIDSVVNEK